MPSKRHIKSRFYLPFDEYGLSVGHPIVFDQTWILVQGLIRHFRGEMEDRIGRAAERIAA